MKRFSKDAAQSNRRCQILLVLIPAAGRNGCPSWTDVTCFGKPDNA